MTRFLCHAFDGCLLLLLLACTPARSADDFPLPYNSETDTTQTLMSATEAAASWNVPDGFTVSVFASEPEVQNPIAMTWDARGRLWIAENYTYAERTQRFDLALRDRVLIFADTDGDGVADIRTVFTDSVQMLTSVEVGHGGVWLMCPPQLLFIPDADGDDVPDGPAQIVLDGFEVARDNYHNFANGLRFGPDGWLYGRCGGSCPGRIGKPGTPDHERFALEGGIWRYHPVHGDCEVLSAGTTNPWGHDWNEVGELFFVNTVNGHLWHQIAGAHYMRPFTLDPNPRVYQMLDMHADHWHFDTGKSWTDSRHGAANALGGGHAHCGTMIYHADQWPAEYRGRLMTINLHGRRVNQELLRRSGSGYVASHGDDILLSDDPFFRGMELSSGPDGAVYVLDWSDTGECHESTGVHRTSGRIFKISYRGDASQTGTATQTIKGTHQNVDLRPASDEQLVALHAHANQWYARQARLLLQHRAAAGQPMEAVAQSLRSIVQSSDAVAAVGAMLKLHAIGELPQAFALAQLQHPQESVRAWAIRSLSDRWPLDDCYGPVKTVPAVDEKIKRRLVEQARSDSSALVRLTLASTLQRLPLVDRAELAIALAAHAGDAEDHNLPLMLWYGLMPLGDSHPLELAEVGARCQWPLTRQLIARRLSERIGDDAAPLEALIGKVAHSGDPQAAHAVILGIAQGLKGWRKAPLPKGWEKLVAIVRGTDDDPLNDALGELAIVFGDGLELEQVRRMVLDEHEEISVRRSALQALVNQRPDDLQQICSRLVGDPRINLIAAQGLALDDDPASAQLLVDSYRRFRSPNRAAVIAILSSRPSFADVLLTAIESGKIARQEVSAYDARAIRSLGDERLTAKLGQVWGEVRQTPEDRQASMAALKQMLTNVTNPAAIDLSAGRALYHELCGKCHKLYGQGEAIGPDLTGSNRNNLDYLIENVLDPSAVVSKDYRVSLLMMADGRVLNGVIVSQNERTVQLQTQTERLAIDKSEIDEVKLTAQSPMPEGQLENLTAEQIRNLFAYLMHPVQVPLPAATD